MATRTSLSGCASLSTVREGTEAYVEGEPFYTLRELVFVGGGLTLRLRLRSFLALPFSDAVGLLDGEDHTGLVVWDGSTLLSQWLLAASVEATTPTTGTATSSSLIFDSSHFVELGAGSGVVSCVLIKLLQQRKSRSKRWVFATDGNEQCVSLSCLNMSQQTVRTDEDGVKEGEDVDARSVISSRATLLDWASSEIPSDIVKAFTSDFRCLSVEEEQKIEEAGPSPLAAPRRLVILSADVLYFKEAVDPLIHAVRTLSAAFKTCDKNCSHHISATTSAVGSVFWLMWYMPRSLRRKENADTFLQLVRGLQQQQQQQQEDDGRSGGILFIKIPPSSPPEELIDGSHSGDGLLDDLSIDMLESKWKSDPLWFPPNGCLFLVQV